MAIYFLDTNILLASILEDDSLHESSTSHLSLCSEVYSASFYTTLPCLLELSYLLGPTRTRLSHTQINQAIDDLLAEYAIQILSLDQPETRNVKTTWISSRVFGKNNKLIDLADYYLVHIADKANATIVTADDDISVLKSHYSLNFEIDPIVESTRKKRR